MAPLLALALISFLSLSTNAEDRAHGLSSEPPVAVTPKAFTFFHPCDSSHCSTLPQAATVKPQSPTKGSHRLGAGGIASISLSFLLVALAVAGMGVYYVINKRKANLDRAKPQKLTEEDSESKKLAGAWEMEGPMAVAILL
ncbi:hypothetical protein SASPL_104406 [Salvia splendens]|uniref:Uncharacterized protein n=1 Tax=Salvia splendens TaxID=180675 RepID=A0A8X8YJV2_SALSN|nr:hypothetical protein SASPL_104406 [Salvia splendens]